MNSLPTMNPTKERGSMIDPEQRENSEASEVGDKSKGAKLSFIVKFTGGIFASAVVSRMK